MPNAVPALEHVTARLNDPNVYTLTVAEVAVARDCSQNFAYAMVSAGVWPSIRNGRRVLVPANWVRQELQIDPAAQRTA